ncbi:hypothetical protein MA16_Dca014522 [Dendrobium catenatum]|uniref:RNase H type-1 domain-containing protein n=1 Tax=Dendrobium catenatum TaxID=906689 RepID=A0A2I0VMN9_9ASPA|nr:hypothetical protein MA16_Dca014522 [Dendrobium catenatum]
MKCEPQLQEQHAVKILLKNIHGPIAFLLKGFTIKTFEKLLNKASNLQEEAPRLRKLPAKLSIYESLLLSKEMRESLIKALLDPEICLAQLASTSKDEALYFKEVSGVTFSDEDLLLGTTDHNRVGLIFITPEGGMTHFSYHLSEPCINNEAEYEALIIDLELAILMEIKVIKIFSDSQLLINQVAGTYKVLNPNLSKYHQYTLH